jgi:hypothetical protein
MLEILYRIPVANFGFLEFRRSGLSVKVDKITYSRRRIMIRVLKPAKMGQARTLPKFLCSM